MYRKFKLPKFCQKVRKIGRLTKGKKVREIQITHVLIVSITISYICCALAMKKMSQIYLSYCQVSVIGMLKSVVKRLLTPLIRLLEHEFIAGSSF